MKLREFMKQNPIHDMANDIEMTDAIKGIAFIGTTNQFRVFITQYPEYLDSEVISSGCIGNFMGKTLQLDVILPEKDKSQE